jgi:ABC-type branched-subunit amino acid transport system substrate-binding protein
MKRLLSMLSLVIVLALLVSACGGGGTTPEEPAEPEAPAEGEETPAEEDAPEEEETEEEAPEEEETEEEATEEETGAVEPVGSGETIKIATQSPLSGPQAAIGVGIRNGAELGLDQLSQELIDLGFEVELAPFDDEAQQEKGVANANNIAADSEILCVVGHLNSGVALAALPVYQNASVTMMSPANTNPNITEGGFENAFRVVGRDDVQGVVGEQFAREELGIETVYIIHDQTDYGQGVAEFFRQSAEDNGLEVLGFEGTQEQSVFDSILTPIQAANPDLIYFGGIYSQAGPFFRQARDRGITAEFMGPDGMDNAELAELAGEAVSGMHYTSVAAPVSQFPDAAQFAEDYEAAYGETAPPFSPQSYDSMGLCITAIADAAVEAGGLPTREQVVDAMASLDEPYEGITGSYEFNDEGDPTEGVYYVLQANVEDWNANELVERLTISPPGTEGEEATEEEATEEEATEEEATEEEATEEEGAEEETGAVEPVGSGETIKIATQSPLSGPQAAIGVGIRNGAELGLEQLAQELIDLGFEVELAPFDDEAQQEKGVANANNIAADSEILCVVGHLNSGVALAALPVYQNAAATMMSPANTNPNITEGGFENAFRIVGRDDVQGVVGEQFAREELGVESVYIIHDQTDYGQGIAEFFRQSAEDNGVEVLGFEGTQEQSVFDSILTPIQAANPDLIYFGGIYSQAGPFFRQARDRGIAAEFMGPDGLDNAELAELAGEAVSGMHYTSVAAPVSQFPDAAQFAEDYESAYGETAPPFSPQSYDSMGLCITAIADAAVEAGGLPTREQVVEAMASLEEPYEGITGSYEFNEEGDPTEGVYYVLQANVEDWNANELVDRLVIAPPED